MLQVLFCSNSILFYFIVWIWLESQNTAYLIRISNDNPFLGIPSLFLLPNSVKLSATLFGNFIVCIIPVIIMILLVLFTTPWYSPLIIMICGYSLARVLFSIKILPSLIGYSRIAYICPLWVVGFIYFLRHF